MGDYLSGTENVRNALIRIAQFVVRKESADLAKNCQDILIKTVLFNAGNTGLDISEITKEIGKQMGLYNLPNILAREIVQRLIKKDEIYEENGKLFLEREECKKIQEAILKRREVLDFIESTIKNKLMKKGLKIDEKKMDLVFDILYKFLAKWFTSESSFAVNLLLLKNVKTLEVPLEILDKTLEEITDDDFKRIIRSVIIETFTESEKIMNFIYETIQSYLHLELLNADPECKCLQKVAFSNTIFILDTNVLMALLLEADPMHEGVTEVISVAQELGIKLVFTKRTKQEWLWGLERANEEFRQIESSRASLLPELENIFIRSYFKEKEVNPSLTWQGFYLQMRELERILKKKGIEYWYKKEHDPEKLRNRDTLEPLNGMVYYCAKKKGNLKSREVCEHDAYHILLVRELREKIFLDTIGPPYWFFTCDTSLLCADEKLNQFLKDSFAPPSSLIASIWIVVIAPFLGPEVSDTKLASAFSNLMKTHFAMMPAGLSADQIMEALGHWLPYKNLSDDDIKVILSDALVIKYFDELKEAQIWAPDKVEELREKLRGRVDEKVHEIFDERITSAQRKLNEVTALYEKERKTFLKLCAIFGALYTVLGLVLLGIGNVVAGVPLILASVVFIGMYGFRKIRIKAEKIGEIEMEK